MTKAYIILAHKNAAQIKRLIESLDDGLSNFFIHIDLKSSLKYEDVASKGNVKIHKIRSVNSKWGHFGLVQATLNAMAKIKELQIGFERIVLLSGQDYPIKGNQFINNFFTNSPFSIFINYSAIPDYNKWPSGGGLYRVDKYFFGFSSLIKFSARIINFLAFFINSLKRKLKKDMNHYHGSQWWTIDSYALNYILDFVNTYPEYVTFHKYTFAPDELFFQTILLNSDDPEIAGKIVNDNNMLIKWEDEFEPHPEILVTADFDLIASSASLFARKFDTNKDAHILALIDERRLGIANTTIS